MHYLDKIFLPREKKYRRNFEIDDCLYVGLETLTTVYDTSVAGLINACIARLIETENLRLYENKRNALPVMHTVLVRESNVIGLDNLRKKYGISIYQLINISIRNVLDEYSDLISNC